MKASLFSFGREVCVMARGDNISLLLVLGVARGIDGNVSLICSGSGTRG